VHFIDDVHLVLALLAAQSAPAPPVP
jgi:hypothetical protein